MKTTGTYFLCILISGFLLGAQIGPIYHHLCDLGIELQETGEESPVEDISDVELEEEKELRDQNISLMQSLLTSKASLSNQVFNLQSPDKDVLSPPPDFK